ncbi:FHA domain-containing protein [Planctomycetota bacterium]
MEQLLDFIFGIRWWQWLLGMSCVAGLYYLIAGTLLPFLKGVHDEHTEEAEQQRQEEEERKRQEELKQREAERREYLKTIPSGPVEPVTLPKAMIRLRNRNVVVPADTETVFGTKKGVAVPVMARGVSREHAKIRPEPRGYVLYDLMSEAGTLVGGQRIESKVLADGDRIKIGPVEMLFKVARSPGGD